MRAAVAIVLLSGCGKENSETVCEAGFAAHDDGNCYQVDAATSSPFSAVETGDTGATVPSPGSLDDLFASLPDCGDLSNGDGALDLSGQCAEPGCASMSYDELNAAYGDGYCAATNYGDISCAWYSYDVYGYFADDDGDGLATGDELTSGLYVGSEFPGTTSGGLRAGLSVACFVDAYGIPDYLEPYDGYGSQWVDWYGWDYGAWYVEDFYTASGDPGGDGLADYIWLNGPG